MSKYIMPTITIVDLVDTLMSASESGPELGKDDSELPVDERSADAKSSTFNLWDDDESLLRN